jgi:hypothetical protein
MNMAMPSVMQFWESRVCTLVPPRWKPNTNLCQSEVSPLLVRKVSLKAILKSSMMSIGVNYAVTNDSDRRDRRRDVDFSIIIRIIKIINKYLRNINRDESFHFINRVFSAKK